MQDSNKKIQILDNLPQELLEQKRFFKVGKDKVPLVTAWSNPDNQCFAKDVKGIAGFDISGHDIADDYLLVDFDHTFNANGDFVNAAAKKWFEFCAAAKSFSELSISRRGAHFLFKPTLGKFETISNGKNGVLQLGDGAKIELFYKTKGRYCLLTGDAYQCEPKAPVVAGDAADYVFAALLKEIADRLQKSSPARQSNFPKSDKTSQPVQIDSPEFDDFRARRMLDVLPVGNLHGNDWLVAMTAIKNLGFSYAEFDAMNIGGENYNEAENRCRWDSVTTSDIGIAALCNLALQYNYDAKAAYHDWLDLHPEFDNRIADKLQSVRFKHITDAEPTGISDSTSPKAKRQERADCMKDLMTTREVADFLGVTVSTVKNWRQRKLFGCYFFPADEKHGDTLYYYRERVEQLKAVYQRGILQNMYKLARKFPETTPPDYFQKSDSTCCIEELSFRHKEFLILDEVADFFGVDKSTVSRWVKSGILKEDMLGHNGDLYFAIDNVLNFTPPKEKQAAGTDKKIPDDMKRDLDAALLWLRSLTPENFTVADARDKCRSVALAAVFGFNAEFEKFFDTLKAAKKVARERLKDNDAAELTQKLSETARLELSALAEGVRVEFIRQCVDREITAVSKKRNEYLKQEEIQMRKKQAEERRRQHAAKVAENVKHIAELQKAPASPERDAELIALIRDSCEWEHDKQGFRKCVKDTADNLKMIFNNDPNISGLVGYDEFLQADVFLKPPIWAPNKKRGAEWGDRDDSHLRLYLRENYKELRAKETINDTVTKYSDANTFNEVKDFFKSLPEWDGVKRAETLFIDWLKVADTKYAREVTLKWLLAAVARIFEPGCKFYWALVLRGNQKIGKSYVFQQLGGKWYKAISDRVDDPHVIDTLRLVWLGEFKEMSGMRKADVNAIKDFIELSADTRRLAYARRAGTYPRHCVFGITVNDDEFFTDATGNRRFLVLDSPLPKFGYVKEVRGEKLSDDNLIKQIWAEVYQLYNELFKGGFDDRKLELSAETEFKGEEIAESYLRDDGLPNEILGYLNVKILPPILWQLLSREERRKFFVDGGKFQIEQTDLNARFKIFAGRRYDELIQEFETACTVRDGQVRHFTDKDNRWQFVFYGTVERQHICAAEVFNECFGADNRKRMTRINEVLAHLDGWQLGERLRNVDTVYPDQKKPYYRNNITK